MTLSEEQSIQSMPFFGRYIKVIYCLQAGEITQQLPKDSGVSFQIQKEADEQNTHLGSTFIIRNMLGVNMTRKLNECKTANKSAYELYQTFKNLGSIEKDVLCWAKGSYQNILNILQFLMSVYYLYQSCSMLKEQSALSSLNDKNQNCIFFSPGTVVQKAYFVPSR